ncbi:hypothetical protein [Vibrio porteresiae]|uniref:DUF4321 domain-containing protein n=1 Tax=Vibrio porteresiae DSM 19223 TaxID=1123496 RepID=A0ABZ0QAL0_9VIBR|nr:hypothetical protein [Vibrio porteresiae]WPC73026.1 hypothetical protein R8Z52_12970 [Vibrio porteresiae DSM 19223]
MNVKKRKMRLPIIAVACSLFFSVVPLLSVMVAGAIANIKHCLLDEGGANPCIIFGIDVGDILYSMLVFGWLMLVSLPLGSVLTIVSVAWLIFVAIQNYYYRKALPEPK